MTFETLNLIHQLLQREELDRRAMLDRAADRLKEAYESGDEKGIEAAKEDKDFARRLHDKALDALNEFNDHEWH